jgi:hypothetical protein
VERSSRCFYAEGQTLVLRDVALDERVVVSRLSAGPASRGAAQTAYMGDLVDLATRRAGSIDVSLLWDRSERTLVVFARDSSTNEELAIPVDGAEATEVYRHPFAYAHRSARERHSPRR